MIAIQLRCLAAERTQAYDPQIAAQGPTRGFVLSLDRFTLRQLGTEDATLRHGESDHG